MEIHKEWLAPCGLYCGVCGILMATRDNNEKFKGGSWARRNGWSWRKSATSARNAATRYSAGPSSAGNAARRWRWIEL